MHSETYRKLEIHDSAGSFSITLFQGWPSQNLTFSLPIPIFNLCFYKRQQKQENRKKPKKKQHKNQKEIKHTQKQKKGKESDTKTKHKT